MKTILFLLSTFIFLNVSQAQVTSSSQDAQALLDKGDYYGALKIYTEIVNYKAADNMFMIYYSRAFCYYKLTDYRSAKSDLKKALKIEPDNKKYNWVTGNSLWMYARIYSKLHNDKKSLGYFIQASKYVQDCGLYSTIGLKQIELKKYQEALTNLNHAIDLDNTDAYAYSNRALARLKLHDLENARIDINRSIELNSKNPYAFKHSAMIYLELKDYVHACEDLNKAKELKYAQFGNEADANEVNELLYKYCGSVH